MDLSCDRSANCPKDFESDDDKWCSMKRLFLTLLLGTLLFIWTLEIAPMPVTAANSMPEAQLSEAIDHFLTSLPSDYYAIARQTLSKVLSRAIMPH